MVLELQLLSLAAAIGLVQIIWGAAAAQPQRGLEWNIGPRDTPVVLTGVAGRLERALHNFLESFPIFVAVVLVVVIAGKAGATLSVWGSILYVAGRALYVPMYAFGVKGVRSLVWGVSLVGIVMVLIAALA